MPEPPVRQSTRTFWRGYVFCARTRTSTRTESVFGEDRTEDLTALALVKNSDICKAGSTGTVSTTGPVLSSGSV
jgi:hypothetical protein